MHSWRSILENPQVSDHFVQLYSNEEQLVSNVTRFLSAGLKGDDLHLVVATEEHRIAFCRELDALSIDSDAAVKNGRLLFLDATETLARFMINGHPNWSYLQRTFSGIIENLRGDSGVNLRIFGEMVGLLWKAGEYSTAIQLEDHWNRLLHKESFSLFCAYPIDIFSREFQVSGVDSLLCDHTHLIPSTDCGLLEQAITGAMLQVLGVRGAEWISRLKVVSRPSWGLVPQAEGMVLWIRENLEHEAEEILRRARYDYHVLNNLARPGHPVNSIIAS